MTFTLPSLKRVYYLASLAALSLHAQDFSPPVILNSNDGLSQNTVHDILQDRYGFLWFATDDGLNRYDGYSFIVYRNNPRKPGTISNNSIRCLIEDHGGRLWIGTDGGGLNIFDPTLERFTVFRNNPSDPRSISENHIHAIIEDSAFTVWIGNDGGLERCDASTGSFEPIMLPARDGEQSHRSPVTALANDSGGAIWIGTFDGTLVRRNNGTGVMMAYSLKAPGEGKSTRSTITAIFADSAGQVWAATNGGGLYLLDKRTGTISHFTTDSKIPYAPFTNILRAILPAGRNVLILLSSRGLDSIDIRTHRITNIWSNHIFTSPQTIRLDASGVLWLGTLGTGVGKFVPMKKRFHTVLKQDSLTATAGLTFSAVRAIYEDRDGDLWVGGHIGLNRLKKDQRALHPDYREGVWENVRPFADVNVFCVVDDPDKRNLLWVGTEMQGLYTCDKRSGALFHFSSDPALRRGFFQGEQVNRLIVTRQGVLFAGSDRGLSRWNKTAGVFDNFIHAPEDSNSIGSGRIISICEDSAGNIWCGSDAGGISILDPSNGRFTHIRSDPGNERSLSNDRVNTVYCDTHGTMWIGTAAGLNKFNSLKNQFSVYTTENGLSNDYIYGILGDRNGNLWLSTNKGISRFDPARETFTNYDRQDGLQADEFNTFAYFQSRRGELFFGGIAGLTSFFPEEIRENTAIPRIVLTDFKIFNQPVHLPGPVAFTNAVTISHSENVFSIEFAALEFTEPMKNRFAYRMEGFDKGWQYTASGQRNVSYTNLNPGAYLFRVKASNNDGVWNETGKALRIIITPPVWSTWWFRGISALILFAAMLTVYRARMNSLRRDRAAKEKFAHQLLDSQESERKRIAAEMHDAVGQDLLIIKNLSFMAQESKDFSAKDKYLNDISGTVSRTIEDVRKISYNLRPYQIDRLGLTKALESILRDISGISAVRFTHDIENIDGIFFKEHEIHIYRMLQECVNNIIKHSEAAEAVVTVRKTDDEVVLTVNDDGKGFVHHSGAGQRSSAEGFGLTGLAERVMIMQGNIDIVSKPQMGTTITIKLPWTIQSAS